MAFNQGDIDIDLGCPGARCNRPALEMCDVAGNCNGVAQIDRNIIKVVKQVSGKGKQMAANFKKNVFWRA